MRIAVAQMRTHAGDFESVGRRMVEQAALAAARGVDLLVFPAAALCGVTPVPPADREGFLVDLASTLSALVEQLACPCLVPVLTDVDGTPVPEALLVNDGDVSPVRLSARLAAAADGSAAGAPEPSDALPELEFAGARLGVAFTYEDLDAYDDYDYDVDIIVFLSGYGFAVDDASSALGSSIAEGRFLADAEATGAWIVGVGSLGLYDMQVFCGSSFVLAPWGELAAQAPSLEEALLVCDVDPSAEGPLDEPLTPEVYDGPLMTWGALTMGLAQAVGERGACALARGDDLGSACALTLAVDALGPLGVSAVVPTGLSPAADAASLELVSALRLPDEAVVRVDVSAAPDERAAHELAVARLAALARDTGRVPLGSTDKTGWALEDLPALLAARLEPLADLYRSDVLSLAHMRNTVSPVIPRAAVASVRVPELGPSLDSVPAGEARLAFVDLVLASHVEWELPVSDIAAERGVPEAVAAVIARLHDLETLRRPVVPSLVVSSRTLDEARLPAGVAWRDRARTEGERLAALVSGLPGSAKATAEPEPRQAARQAESHERDVRDLLGYLRDFSQGGGFSALAETGAAHDGGRHQGGGPSSASLWDGPFSEN